LALPFCSQETCVVNSNDSVLSGIQPTGEMHLGNYFGAIANWVRMARAAPNKCIYGVVDLHAMTMPYDPAKLRANTQRMMIDLLACGIDPELCTLFVQSLVPEHTELCWILSCVCSYGDLTRMTQFKDKTDDLNLTKANAFVSSGLFLYPVLQAADILVYRAKWVPVGKDQSQHLELSREIARSFNHRFGPIFPEPQPKLTETPLIYSLVDPTKKMGKSLGEQHCVGLFESEEAIRKKIRSAVTDMGGPAASGQMSPGVKNLLELLRACEKGTIAAEFDAHYRAGTIRYVDLKNAVADAVIETVRPIHKRRAELLADEARTWSIVENGSRKAREIARATLHDVRMAVGLPV
jgi:tryptophanyl-tRNA synthetase